MARKGNIAGDAFKGMFGALGAIVVYIAVGMMFIIPGMYFILKEHKRPADQRSKGRIILGMVLVVIGCIISLGMGFELLGTGMDMLVS